MSFDEYGAQQGIKVGIPPRVVAAMQTLGWLRRIKTPKPLFEGMPVDPRDLANLTPQEAGIEKIAYNILTQYLSGEQNFDSPHVQPPDDPREGDGPPLAPVRTS